MLKDLIFKFGKEKLNTLTKYPSILTLHQLGDKGVLLNEFTTPIQGEKIYATEKVDGTNVRILSFGGEFIFGSREYLLCHNNDLFYDPSQGIVEYLRSINVESLCDTTDKLIVFYGEMYGGKVHANSKNYGTSSVGFRLFDVAIYDDLYLHILNKTLPEISRWREKETEQGLVYGQNFISRVELKECYGDKFDIVPDIEFEVGDMSHETILQNMKKSLPHTRVALTQTALMRAEGLVLRNENRTKIVKIRFEDYEKTIRKNKK